MGDRRGLGVLVALLIGGAASGCGSHTPASMATAPASIPAEQAAAAGTPGLVWYLKGADPSLRRSDWSGRLGLPFAMPAAPPSTPRYPGKAAPTHLGVGSVSPDGSRIMFLNDGSVRDADGAVVGRIDPNLGLLPTWADDSRHYCRMTTPGYESFTGGTLTGPAVLTWGAVGSAPRTVASVGRFGANAMTSIEACSARTGVAVLAERTASDLTQAAKTGLDPVTELVVVNLSDGSVLYRRGYPVTSSPVGGTLTTVSSDGRYVAEVFTVVRQGPAAKGQIRALPQGSVVATLGQTIVQGFSGDDELVFVGGAGTTDNAQLVSWRTGQVLRTEPGPQYLSASQPGGSAFMVRKPTTRGGLLRNDLWLVPASGMSRLVDTDVLDVYGSV
ncbi:MAG: hypothetical protein E6J20_12415 [Chloroflexi bacterium]|nr:MAG: hypothetical protein E6J20_12415 [Chloroflexota bacterium]